MNKLLLVFVIASFSPLLCLAETRPLVITNVTVISATGAEPQSDMTVVITADRIAALGKTGETRTPENSEVIDASGKFLIPGLWDMHVHWYDKRFLPLFTANGVTGIRQMFGVPRHLEWRKELADGSLLGPRMVLAGRIVDGLKAIWPNSISAGTTEQARKAVQITRAEGYDFVKVYSALPRAAYFAIAEETKKEGFTFAGHVPHAVSAAEASDAGQKSIEHMTGILLGCSSQEEALRQEMLENLQEGSQIDATMIHRGNDKCLESYDREKAAALFARFVRNGTWQVPTLTTARALAHLDDEQFTSDPRVKYLPLALRKRWNPRNDFRFKNMKAEAFASQRKVFRKRLAIIGEMHRAGVGILAGTDVLNPFCFPGFSLHDELALLVEAGLSPMQALRTATLNPAQFLNQQADHGTVELGKIADLVLLDANPLDDITNTRKIDAVVVGGRLLARETLRKILVDAEVEVGKR